MISLHAQTHTFSAHYDVLISTTGLECVFAMHMLRTLARTLQSWTRERLLRLPYSSLLVFSSLPARCERGRYEPDFHPVFFLCQERYPGLEHLYASLR